MLKVISRTQETDQLGSDCRHLTKCQKYARATENEVAIIDAFQEMVQEALEKLPT